MKRTFFILLLLAVLLSAAAAEDLSFADADMTMTESVFAAAHPESELIKADEETPYDRYIIDDTVEYFFFPESGRLRSEALVFDGIVDIGITVFAASLENYSQARLSMKYERFCELMGSDGTEIMVINESDADNAPVQTVYIWAAENGDTVQAIFDDDMELIYVNYSVEG